MYYPKNFEEKVGFDRVRYYLKEECLSSLGEQKVDEMRFSTDYEAITLALNQTEEFRQICIIEEEFPVSYYIDVRPYLQKIKIEGTFLSVTELFDFKRSLDTIRAIVRFFKNKPEEQYPFLRQLLGDVTLFPYIYERIDTILDKNGYIKNSASPELQTIRRDIEVKRGAVSKRMQTILRHAQQEGWLEDDASITIRDGKMLIPVPTMNKRRIKGIVHDESATGKTAFVEPVEIVEANNEIKELEFAERREIIRILTRFADDIRPYLEELIMSYDFLGEIDFIRSKASFALKINALKPLTITNTPELEWFNATHPLLYLSLKKEGKDIVPLSIRIDSNDRIILISGPNAGGKSVCLKTVGLLQYMFQCGLLVSVRESSQMGLFDNLFIDIGDEQSIENDLSTYSSHLKSMKFFTENANDKTLILIDEFGTGTEPLLGASIAEAVLEEFNARKATGIITTHYTSLKHYATATDGIVNAAMLFDSHRLQPLFQLEIGKPGSSYAFEIAKKIGLPQSVLESATKKIGQEHIDFDKNLKDIERDRRYVAEKRKKVHQLEKKLEGLLEKYNLQQEELTKKRKEIVQQAQAEAKQMLDSVNKQIERTISDIKQANAEKEKTKDIRQNLEVFKQEVLEQQRSETEKIDEQMQRIKRKQEEREKRKQTQEGENPQVKEEKKSDNTINVGDKVRVKGQGTTGEVLSLKGKQAEISFGLLRSFVDLERLEKISNNEVQRTEKKARYQPVASTTNSSISDEILNRKLHFKPDIDLRGKRTDEALQLVERMIDDALVSNVHEIRILHGTGFGILRKMIRDYLNSQAIVKRCRDEHIELGGAGITIVELDY